MNSFLDAGFLHIQFTAIAVVCLFSVLASLKYILLSLAQLLQSRRPFLERPGKLTGPVSYFEIEVSRKVGCALTSNEVHFVSIAENFTV